MVLGIKVVFGEEWGCGIKVPRGIIDSRRAACATKTSIHWGITEVEFEQNSWAMNPRSMNS
jgi:hypothetical protein